FKITKRPITITAGSDTKSYDGNALTCDEFDTTTVGTNAGLAVGDKVSDITVTGSQTEAGSSDNVASDAVIVNGVGDVVTDNYTITYKVGTLTVTKAVDTEVTAEIDDKYYDGTAIADPTYTSASTGAASFVFYEVDDQGNVGTDKIDRPIDAGTYAVVVKLAADANHAATKSDAVKFEIIPRPITITAKDATKVYDGTKLTCDEYLTPTVTVDADGNALTTGNAIASIDKLESVVVSGSQIEVGKSANTAADAKIVLESDNTKDRTSNYDITYVDGTLTVTRANEEVTLSDISKVYDGTKADKPEVTSIAGGVETVNYFIKEGTKYTELNTAPTNVGTYYVRVTTEETANYKAGDSGYVEFEITKRPITIIAESDIKYYDTTPLTCDEIEVVTGAGLAIGDKISDITITGSQTEVGESDNIASDAVIVNGVGDVVTDNYTITYEEGILIVIKANDALVTASIDDKIYDGEAIADPTYESDSTGTPNFVFYAVDEHGNIGTDEIEKPKDAGTYVVVVELAADANYEATKSAPVTFTIAKRPITITAKDATKVYDGTELTNDGYLTPTVTVDADGNPLTTGAAIAIGDKLTSVTVTGSQTEVGESANTAADAKIVLESDDLKDRTDNYDITYVDGTLTVTKADEEVTLSDISKVYDGTKADKPEVTSIAGGIETVKYFTKEGTKYTELKTAPTDVGTYYVRATTEETADYKAGDSGYVEFVIAKRPITITAGSDEKLYDGTKLTCDEIEAPILTTDTVAATVAGVNVNLSVTGSAIVDGDKISDITLTGSQTEVGTSDNKASKAVVVNGVGDLVTDNYDITYETGTLTVNKAKGIDVLAEIEDKMYDGKPIADPTYTSEATGTATFKFYDVDKDGKVKVDAEGNPIEIDRPVNAGTYAVVVELEADDTYEATKSEPVTFTIEKRPITITAPSASKAYDGDPLTAKTGVTIEFTGDISKNPLANTDMVEDIVITGSQTEVGESANVASDAKIVDNKSGEDKTANYDIVYEDGTLTVGYVIDGMKVSEISKLYDGKPVSKPDVIRNGTGDLTIEYFDKNSDGTYTKLNEAPIDAGEYFVKVSAEADDVYDAQSTDYIPFEIYKREITITAGSAEKLYSGTALTDDSFTYKATTGSAVDTEDETALVKSHEIYSVAVTGSIIEVGETDNVASDALIINGAGRDVTDNYDITYENGKLTVLAVPPIEDVYFEKTSPVNKTVNILDDHEVSSVKVDGKEIFPDKVTVKDGNLVIDKSAMSGLNPGTYPIVITYSDGVVQKANLIVREYDESTVVKRVPIFSMTKIVIKGKKFKLNIAGISKNAKVTYTTSKKKIATINNKGVITGKKLGKCKVKCLVIQNGSYYKVNVNIIVKKKSKNAKTNLNLKNNAITKVSGDLPEYNIYKKINKKKKTTLTFTNVEDDAKIKFYTTKGGKKIALGKVSHNKTKDTASIKVTGKKKGWTFLTAKITQNGKVYYTRIVIRINDSTWTSKQIGKYLKKSA
ncbi:MAG: MBG domain-containing protein, partial [Lachnospiraceae bacterium]|nr:MBG domain-containing protein [Lachnospiraceae bacterium]